LRDKKATTMSREASRVATIKRKEKEAWRVV
jgi:hypothetical protein